MGYLSTVDKKETIKQAKKELNDFADVLRLVAPIQFPGIKSICYSNFFPKTKSNYHNYDVKMLYEIDRKDKRIRYIEKTINILNTLDLYQIELIWMRHVERKSCNEISILLNIDRSTANRWLNESYYLFAISANLMVEEDNI